MLIKGSVCEGQKEEERWGHICVLACPKVQRIERQSKRQDKREIERDKERERETDTERPRNREESGNSERLKSKDWRQNTRTLANDERRRDRIELTVRDEEAETERKGETD